MKMIKMTEKDSLKNNTHLYLFLSKVSPIIRLTIIKATPSTEENFTK